MSFFHDASLALQERFDSRRIADQLEKTRLHTTFTEDDSRIIESAAMFFLATSGPGNKPDCSVKGGVPGFVKIMGPNPALRIEVFDGVREENVERFLDKVDVLCDALDYFVIEPRILVYRQARKMGIPAVIACPIGFGGTLHNFDPEHMSFEEYFDLYAGMDERQKLVNFGIGLDPARLHRHYLADPQLDFEQRKVASLSSSCLLASTLTGSFTLAKLLNRKMFFKPVPFVYQIDYMAGQFVELNVAKGVAGLKAEQEQQAA